jgi:hypothetical protein
MELKEPFAVYTAATNLEAHMIVDMLKANGIAAFADEDQSGVSLWAFGTISQFHKPRVWIEKSACTEAARLILDFEERKRQRQNPDDRADAIKVECEECGKTSTFPGSLNGTTQECSHCGAFVDVGEFRWDDDLGEFET